MAVYIAPSDGFSDDSFWSYVKRFCKKIGYAAVEIALWLYYAFKSKDTPLWAKATIMGALAYLINPIDAIPDVVPGVGFSDDITIMLAAAAAVAAHITPDIKARAQETLNMWFGTSN